MTKNKQHEDEAPPASNVVADAPADQGTRQRRAFMLKQLIPSQDWIMKEVVAKGKGTRVTLGRVYGVCTSTAVKVNRLPDGKEVSSTVLNGMFQAESYLDGEVSDSVQVYLPAAYADKVKAIMDADATIKVVELDCDIGLEATGKTIPYEWVVTAFREGEGMAIMKRLRSSRARPANAPRLAAPAAPKQLTAS